MIDSIADFLVQTSFFLALLFISAGVANATIYKTTKRPDRLLRAVSLCVMGVLYLGTQFGGDWFLAYQRVWFRAGTTLLVTVEIYSALHVVGAIGEMRKWIGK